MEHHPGNHIVQQAKAALGQGRRVYLLIRHRPDMLYVKSADLEGPLAVVNNGNGDWYIRLDELVGYHVQVGA